MVGPDVSTEFAEITGERICNGLRSTARNWPAYSMSSHSQDQTECGRSDRFQGQKRMCCNSRKQRPRCVVLEKNLRQRSCRTKGRDSKPRQRQGMSRQMQHRLQKFVSQFFPVGREPFHKAP